MRIGCEDRVCGEGVRKGGEIGCEGGCEERG